MLIDLDAGVQMMSNLVGTPPKSVRAVLRLALPWDPLPHGRHLPVFRAADLGAHRAD